MNKIAEYLDITNGWCHAIIKAPLEFVISAKENSNAGVEHSRVRDRMNKPRARSVSSSGVGPRPFLHPVYAFAYRVSDPPCRCPDRFLMFHEYQPEAPPLRTSNRSPRQLAFQPFSAFSSTPLHLHIRKLLNRDTVHSLLLVFNAGC